MRTARRTLILPLVARIPVMSNSVRRATWHSENIESGADITVMGLRRPRRSPGT